MSVVTGTEKFEYANNYFLSQVCDIDIGKMILKIQIM